MILVDTSYDIRYESLTEARKRLFDDGASYLIYWGIRGLSRDNKRKDMAVFTDYNADTDDFAWVWGIHCQPHYDTKVYEVVDNQPTPRCFGNMHNHKSLIFRLTEDEVTNKVYMEVV